MVTQCVRKVRADFINNTIASAFEDHDTKPYCKFIKATEEGRCWNRPIKEGWSAFFLMVNLRLIYWTASSVLYFLGRTFHTDPLSLSGSKFPDISGLIITVNGVTKLLSNVMPNKATEPDNLPCRLLKEASNEIALIVTDIFISSLSAGTLPSNRKKARVAPVFKKGNTNDSANYRPISLTCVCSKVMGHIICNHVHGHLDHHSILSKVQHGFRTGHTCISQLLNTVQDLMVAYDKHKQSDVAVLDFSKAFDVVPHQRLLAKLQHRSRPPAVPPLYQQLTRLCWVPGPFIRGRLSFI